MPRIALMADIRIKYFPNIQFSIISIMHGNKPATEDGRIWCMMSINQKTIRLPADQ